MDVRSKVVPFVSYLLLAFFVLLASSHQAAFSKDRKSRSPNVFAVWFRQWAESSRFDEAKQRERWEMFLGRQYPVNEELEAPCATAWLEARKQAKLHAAVVVGKDILEREDEFEGYSVLTFWDDELVTTSLSCAQVEPDSRYLLASYSDEPDFDSNLKLRVQSGKLKGAVIHIGESVPITRRSEYRTYWSVFKIPDDVDVELGDVTVSPINWRSKRGTGLGDCRVN